MSDKEIWNDEQKKRKNQDKKFSAPPTMSFLFWIIVFTIVILLIFNFLEQGKPKESFTESQFKEALEEKRVESLKKHINSGQVLMKIKGKYKEKIGDEESKNFEIDIRYSDKWEEMIFASNAKIEESQEESNFFKSFLI